MATQHFIEKVWVDDNQVFAKTEDGLIASYRFSDWERLRNATQSQREDFTLSYYGIHWPQLDEDLSFEGMFSHAGLCNRTLKEDSVCYIKEG